MKDFLIRLEQKPITDKLDRDNIPEWFCRDVATEWIEEGSLSDRDMALKSLEASGVSVNEESNTVTITKDFWIVTIKGNLICLNQLNLLRTSL